MSIGARGVLRTVWLCFAACVCEGIDLQAAGVAGPGIRAEFNSTAQALGWFFSAGTIGLFIGAALGGWLADRAGRKRVLVASVAAFGLFSLLTATSQDVHTLTALRLLTGFGLGGALPNLIALASEAAPAQRRNAYVSLIYAGAPLGGAVASVVSMVNPLERWRWIFIVGGMLPLLVVPLLARWLEESARFRTATVQVVTTGRLLQLFSSGRAVRTLLLWGASFLILLTLYLLLNWLPLLMKGSGMSTVAAGAAQCLFNVGGAIGAALIGRVLESRGRTLGVALTYGGLPVLLGILVAIIGAPAGTLLVLFLLGATVLSAQAILYAIAPLCYPTQSRGTGVGFVVSIGRLGSALGPLLGSTLVQAGRSPGAVLGGLLPLALLGCAIALLIAWRRVVPED